VGKALWASVEPDALVWDRETAIVVETEQGEGDNTVGRNSSSSREHR